MATKAGKSATKAPVKSSSKTRKTTPKMNYYSTVGTIKSLNLSACTFTLEPISKYRFAVKDDDESSWQVVFKEEGADSNTEPTSLRLIPQGFSFKFKKGLESAMVVLKQAKTHVRITGQIPGKKLVPVGTKVIDVSIEVL